MANWADIPVKNPGDPARAVDYNQTNENIEAAFEKASGAPVLANGYVVEAMVGSGAISRTKLKSTTASQSVSVGGSGGTASITPTGGDYSMGWFAGAAFSTISYRLDGATYSASVRFSNSDAVSRTAYLYSRYIQASPPYNLGNGNIPLFVFAAIDNNTGKVIAASAAEDPPWAYHGPTDITADRYDEQGRGWRGDVEITQAVKQADMPLYPHPWAIDEMAGDYRVVMLNPFDEKITTLATGEITQALHNGAIKIGATVTGLHTPPGVDFVEWEIGEPDVITPEQLLSEARASASLTCREFFLGLDAMGMYDTVMGILDDPDVPRAVKIELETATSFERMWPTLVQMAVAMGVTDEQLDELFGIEVPQ
jgi:hypothetical protein